ncbi:unnamed protein product, partial [Tetraodon nigroviridis]
SSFRKALKSQQRNHHERSQPAFRKNLGLLEKKKDYKLRADDYHKKQNTLAALRKKALDKNPDEFYFKMISSQLQDGVHVTKQDKEEMMTEEQKKVMRTQDIKYVEMKRVAEAKAMPSFDLANHLQTAPELVNRVYNRPTLETLETKSVKGDLNPRSIMKMARIRKHQYKMLSQRIDREKKMFVIAQKIQTRKDLQVRKKVCV